MLDMALKEWAVVCDLLLSGEQVLLLRKGGIHEWGGPGVFRLEHPRFLLWPSWAHQKPEMLKAQHQSRAQMRDEPAKITFEGLAEAAQIWRVRDRASLEAVGDMLPWTGAYVDMRFNYKPENPLYLMALRAYKLATPATVDNRAVYSGCVSWVPLVQGDAVDETGATPVLSETEFGRLLLRVHAAVA